MPFSGQAQMAGKMQFTDRSDGGVNIQFKNGCFIWYNQYASRGGNTGGCTDQQFFRADEAANSRLNGNAGGASSGSGNSVSEGQMQKFCQGEASAELGVNPRDISTRPVEKTNSGRFIVWGQSPPYGSNVTTFACGFDSRGRFQKVEVKSRPNDGWNPSNGNSGNTRLPGAAESRCREVFGASSDITEVSPLRPGYWEVILQARSGRRMAACTVASNGDIQNWVELN